VSSAIVFGLGLRLALLRRRGSEAPLTTPDVGDGEGDDRQDGRDDHRHAQPNRHPPTLRTDQEHRKKAIHENRQYSEVLPPIHRFFAAFLRVTIS
jgi:hypothetical protein